MISVATLFAVASLGLAQTPSLGIACPNAPNVTTCGRIGISVTLKRPALAVEAELDGKKVRLDQGGFAGRARKSGKATSISTPGASACPAGGTAPSPSSTSGFT